MDILSSDLKNSREELSRRDAIFVERVTLIESRVQKKKLFTIRTLDQDLSIVTSAMEKEEEEYKKEKTLNASRSQVTKSIKVFDGTRKGHSIPFHIASSRSGDLQWIEEQRELHKKIEEL